MPKSRKHPQERPITNRSGQQYPGEIAVGRHAAPEGLPGAKTHANAVSTQSSPRTTWDWCTKVLLRANLIPFDSLVDSVTKLHLRDKFRLWELLDEQMADVEEELWDEDPAVQAEIREARDAYQAGDYVTIDEYIAPLQVMD